MRATNTCVEAREAPQVLSSSAFHTSPSPLIFEPGFLTELELTSLGYASWPGTSRVPLCLPPGKTTVQISHHSQIFACVPGSNSGLHACSAGALLTSELSPKPQVLLFYKNMLVTQEDFPEANLMSHNEKKQTTSDCVSLSWSQVCREKTCCDYTGILTQFQSLFEKCSCLCCVPRTGTLGGHAQVPLEAGRRRRALHLSWTYRQL